jgi:proline dehydrogenase
MKLLYPLAKRFIAGHDFESARPIIRGMMDDGYEVSIDYIGENSKSYTQARRAYKQYKQIINEFKGSGIDISIKPSQLGLNIHPYLSYIFLHSLAKLSSKYGQTIRLDMEDSSVTELTRNLAISLHRKYGNVGVAVQANLYRTDEDLKHLIKFGVSVRLVKGAYKESPEIARPYEDHVRASFFDYAARLYSEKTNRPAIATHDEELLNDIEELVPNPNYYDYEFLYGIRRDLQKKYKKQGKTVRIYIPFGTEWLPYTLRRLKGWKNLKFVIKNIFKEWFN